MKHKPRQPRRRWGGALLLIFLVCATAASAQYPVPASVPDLVNYQGLVQLTNGTSNITGIYDMAFYLYDEIIEGTLLWAEEHARVPIVRGRFNVVFGGGLAPTGLDPAPRDESLAEAFRNDGVFLKVAVGLDDVSEVRQRFLATPHAFRAQNATRAVHGVPPGTVMPFAGAGDVPYGWEPCDGRPLGRVGKYEALFLALGAESSPWGAGDGSTTFNVPNLGGRIPIGVDGGHALGVRVGKETHALTEAQTPGHTHPYQDHHYLSNIDCPGFGPAEIADNNLDTTWDSTDSTGGGAGHNNIMASAVVKYIIKW